jgi:hypothetical protein
MDLKNIWRNKDMWFSCNLKREYFIRIEGILSLKRQYVFFVSEIKNKGG